MKCPKCGGEMEEGVNLDYVNAGPNFAKWAKAIKGQIFKSTTEEKFITAYRCTKCGFLETYAK